MPLSLEIVSVTSSSNIVKSIVLGISTFKSPFGGFPSLTLHLDYLVLCVLFQQISDACYGTAK